MKNKIIPIPHQKCLPSEEQKNLMKTMEQFPFFHAAKIGDCVGISTLAYLSNPKCISHSTYKAIVKTSEQDFDFVYFEDLEKSAPFLLKAITQLSDHAYNMELNTSFLIPNWCLSEHEKGYDIKECLLFKGLIGYLDTVHSKSQTHQEFIESSAIFTPPTKESAHAAIERTRAITALLPKFSSMITDAANENNYSYYHEDLSFSS
jgi:hypothetical protein